MSSFSASRRSSQQDNKRKITSIDRRNELERAREANRIHCKETRDRKRERERLLREEVEVLTLYKSIVEDGPDLFSLHNPTSDAPFRRADLSRVKNQYGHWVCWMSTSRRTV
eukprot:jgi/Undpi1/5676/HiC_scaffold_2.g00950.m1